MYVRLFGFNSNSYGDLHICPRRCHYVPIIQIRLHFGLSLIADFIAVHEVSFFVRRQCVFRQQMYVRSFGFNSNSHGGLHICLGRCHYVLII